MSIRTIFTSMSAVALIVLMAGCGSSLMNISGNNGGSGPAPTVAAVALQVNGVQPNNKQEVQFNEAMDASTINTQTFTVTDPSGHSVGGMVAYDGSYDIASFQPSPALQSDTTYTATITTGAASAGGAHLAKPYTYTFTTTYNSTGSYNENPISISSVSPTAGATCVSTTTPITMTFNEAPDASTVTSANIVVSGPGGTVIPVTMSINVTTTQVVLTPDAALPSGTISVTVQKVADLAGDTMASPYTWSFSTACGGGTGGGAATQYTAPIINTFNQPGSATLGQITMDTNGNMTIQLSGATASSSYVVQFCPAFDSNSSNQAPSCFDITTVSVNGSGDGSAAVKFPQPGDWAGDFYLNDSSGKHLYQTYLLPTSTNETYMATLLPDTKTNGGAVTTYSAQEPLSSGTVTFSNGTLTFTVKGASPNTSYSTSSSETVYMQSSGSYQLSTFTTDGSGNGNSTFTWGNDSPGGDLFEVEVNVMRPSSAGYTGGFSVPQ